ncbi:MAG: toprim domain-containing protein [Chloroflexota bacterium]
MRLQTAKEKTIPDFLERLGYTPAKIVKGEYWYCSPLRDSEQVPSFKISRDGKAWFDHALGRGGNIIALAQVYFKITDFRIILKEFDRLYYSDTRQKPLFPTPALSKTNSLSLTPSQPNAKQVGSDAAIFKPLGNNLALVQYLAERGISLEIATPYLQEIYYRRAGKSYFALAFSNNVGGYELRNAYFKGNRGGKSLTTIVKTHHAPDKILLFEGFMDFLSYLSHQQQAISPCPVIVLNGVAQVTLAIAEIQRLGAETVESYGDHDASGREMVATLKKALPACNIIDASGIYTGFDDYNAFIQAQAEATRVTHEKKSI